MGRSISGRSVPEDVRPIIEKLLREAENAFEGSHAQALSLTLKRALSLALEDGDEGLIARCQSGMRHASSACCANTPPSPTSKHSHKYFVRTGDRLREGIALAHLCRDL